MKSFYSLFILIAASVGAQAQTQPIALESLGRLHLEYETPKITSMVPTPAVNGEVSNLPGSGYQLILPFRALQQRNLAAPQSAVDAEKPLIKLTGSEVHHFYERLSAQKEIYAQAQARYQQNLPLFKNKSINQQSWQAIADHYFATKLELGHLEHAEELLKPGAHDDEALLISPVAGIFIPRSEQLDGEAYIYAEVIETEEMRLKVQLPSSLANKITALKAGRCVLSVEYRERISNGLVTRLWSSPISETGNCELSFALNMMITPVIEEAALSVPATSVFFFEGKNYALLKTGNQLTPVEVDIIGRYHSDLLIGDHSDLRNGQVLTTSVSAVQGILLGLGGE